MIDISVIILVGKEKLHISRCLERLVSLEPKQVFVVESQQPDDGTHEIAIGTAKELNWQVEENIVHSNHDNHDNNTTLYAIFHAWPGLYAKQFNWALDNLPIESKWILRLDADEYLYPATCLEVKRLLSSGNLPFDVTSLSLNRARAFCGHKIHFGGTAHIPMVRFFKYRIGRCEDRAMDEHIITSEGHDYRLKGEFVDDNLNSMDWWREKHRGYAKREATDAIAFERGEIHFKGIKEKYYRMPRYFRAFIYFFIRYILRGGFLDGYAGWMWHFWQGLWYRWLVDVEIGRLKMSTMPMNKL